MMRPGEEARSCSAPGGEGERGKGRVRSQAPASSHGPPSLSISEHELAQREQGEAAAVCPPFMVASGPGPPPWIRRQGQQSCRHVARVVSLSRRPLACIPGLRVRHGTRPSGTANHLGGPIRLGQARQQGLGRVVVVDTSEAAALGANVCSHGASSLARCGGRGDPAGANGFGRAGDMPGGRRIDFGAGACVLCSAEESTVSMCLAAASAVGPMADQGRARTTSDGGRDPSTNKFPTGSY